MNEQVREGLASVRAISSLFLVATATIALIGLSPDRLRRYSEAAAALDSLPPYPSVMDTSSDPLAHRLEADMAQLNATMRALDPMRATGLSGLDRLTMPTHDLSFASRSTSSDLFPSGLEITLPSDHSVSERIALLEAVRRAAATEVPNADSLAVQAYGRLRADPAPKVPLVGDFSLAASDSETNWIALCRVQVLVRAHVSRDSTRPQPPRSVAGWRDSFVVSVPADSAYVVGLRQLSWHMRGYYHRQQWLTNRPGPESVSWRELSRYMLEPLSPAALSPIDRVKPVLLEVAEMDAAAARRYLHEKVELLTEHGSVSILGLTLGNDVAFLIVPLIFLGLATLLLFHLMSLGRHLPQGGAIIEEHAWAPLFPGWTGVTSGFALLIAAPGAAAAALVRSVWHDVNRLPTIGLAALGAAASISGFIVLTQIRRRTRGTRQEARGVEPNSDVTTKVALYGLLVDQLTKYNAILWQAPALLAANLVVFDRALNAWPWIEVALAVFNWAMIYAFHRMVVRQTEITRAAEKAQDALRGDYPAFVPTFKNSGPSSRGVLVWTMTALNVWLMIYALYRATRAA